MPRKSAMPDRELAICRRLLAFRLTTKLSRMAVARELGVNSSTLNNYERAIIPLPYALGSKFCAVFGLSQQWLAHGSGDAADYIVIAPQIDVIIPPRLWFSLAYDRFIEPLVSAQPPATEPEFIKTKQPQLKATGFEVKVVRSIGAATSAVTRAALAGVFKSVMDALPAHLVWPYYRQLLEASNQFQTEHPAESEKRVLTDSSEYVIMPPVKSELEDLLADARRLTTPRGMKAKLARALQVPMPRVSDWLAGNYLPSGERALRLREWVRAQERQQKQSPGGAINTTRAKTQAQKSSHENQTRVRKRR